MSSVGAHMLGTLPRGPTEAFSLRTAWRIRPVRLIIYFGIAITAAIVAAGGFAVLNLRESILSDTERELQNVALIFAAHFERTFRALALTQLGFVQQVQSFNIASV